MVFYLYQKKKKNQDMFPLKSSQSKFEVGQANGVGPAWVQKSLEVMAKATLYFLPDFLIPLPPAGKKRRILVLKVKF